MTPLVTVIVPTFNHGPLLRLAVESVLRQREPRFEVVIIGDGATPETRAAAERLTRINHRVRYAAFDKDSSKGERYRSLILEQAQGDVICYLADDDLWTPDHVETMLDLLTGREGGDFAMTLQVRPSPRHGGLTLGPAGYVDLARPLHRRLCAQPTSGFANGLSCAAHTLDFYRTLPHGWQTTPAGLPTDGWMWRQCLGQPGVRVRSRCRATVIHFHSPPRRDWPTTRRLDEMTRFCDVLVRGGWDDDLRRLERTCARLPATSRAWQFLWMQMHASVVTGRPLKRLASLVANRPVP